MAQTRKRKSSGGGAGPDVSKDEIVATPSPSARKQSPSDLPQPSPSKRQARPSSVNQWKPAHVAAYLRASGNSEIADAVEEQGLNGRAACMLTVAELNILNKKESKSAQAALQNLQHPLMPTFISMDSDCSNTISADELAHVLTRVKGREITETQAARFIRDADADDSGDVDFEEFKGIIERSTGSSAWHKAARAVGAPAALLQAGQALRDQADHAMQRTHQALRRGSERAKGSRHAGLLIPTVMMRLVAVELIATVFAGMLIGLTLGLGGLFGLLCLLPRGQALNHWFFGLQYRDSDSGEVCSSSWMLRSYLAVCAIQGALYALCWATFLPWPVFYLILDAICAHRDADNRTFTDFLLGCIVVYKPVGKVGSKWVYDMTAPTYEAAMLATSNLSPGW